ncbi:MAG: VOC family protein, partial [Steroidobacteraceae bacterium]
MAAAVTPPFSIAGIDHIVLRARDSRRLVAFYSDVMGCPVEREQPQIGLTQLRAGRSLIDVLEDASRGTVAASRALAAGTRNVDHFCLTIDPFDPDRLRTYLVSRGVAPGEVAMRYGAEGEGPSIYFQDPEGNEVELKAARTGA